MRNMQTLYRCALTTPSGNYAALVGSRHTGCCHSFTCSAVPDHFCPGKARSATPNREPYALSQEFDSFAADAPYSMYGGAEDGSSGPQQPAAAQSATQARKMSRARRMRRVTPTRVGAMKTARRGQSRRRGHRADPTPRLSPYSASLQNAEWMESRSSASASEVRCRWTRPHFLGARAFHSHAPAHSPMPHLHVPIEPKEGVEPPYAGELGGALPRSGTRWRTRCELCSVGQIARVKCCA